MLPFCASAPALVAGTNLFDGGGTRAGCVAGTTGSGVAHCPRMQCRPLWSFETSTSLVGSSHSSLGSDFAWDLHDSYALTNTGWASDATRMPAFCNDCINAVSSIRK